MSVDGNIPEHAMLGESGKPDLDQSPEAIETVQKVMREFKKLKQHRSRYDRWWMHYYKMFRGDHWHNIRMPRWRQKEIINMIWQTIQSNMPLQTDARPKPTFIPEEPNDKEFASVLNDVLESDWERNNWLLPLSEMILDGYLYGTSLGCVKYNRDADFGLGSVEYQSEDVFYHYPDNEAREVNDSKSKIWIEAEPVDTDTLKREYPEWSDKIKADITDSIRSTKTALNDFRQRTTNSDLNMPDFSYSDGSFKDMPKTMKITAYMKPDETEEIETDDVDDEGQPISKVIVKKVYPKGRKLVIANGILLEESDLSDSCGRFPFVKYVNYILPREFYGASEVEQLESPQRAFNKILNASLEILNLMGNPVWVIDSASGVDPDQLVNRTGLVVEKEPGSEVRREAGVQLSPTALSLIDRLETWFNNVSGTQDVSRGQTPGSVTAASAIEQLMDASRTRIKQKQRNLDAMMRDFGQHYVDLVLKYYTKSRIFRVTNNQDKTKYFKFRVEKRDDPDDLDQFGVPREKTYAMIKEYVEDSEGNIIMSPEEKEYLISGRFDVRVNTGSSLPFAVADKERKAFELYDRGIIDEKEVLEQIDYPNREAVLQRLEERKAEAAAMQQQQGA